MNSDPSSASAKLRLTISGRLSIRPVWRLMAMIGSTMPSSAISSTTSPTEPESMHTRPAATLDARPGAPAWSTAGTRRGWA
jgi:hypothetical protein